MSPTQSAGFPNVQTFVILMSFLFLFSGTGCLPPPADEKVVDRDEESKASADELVPALPGVGKQGQKVGDGNGYLTTVAGTFFKTKQSMVFEIMIPHAMQLYKAQHEHFPKTEEEFFREIISFNNIQLPELPDGHNYVYDPVQGQLMVRRPVE